MDWLSSLVGVWLIHSGRAIEFVYVVPVGVHVRHGGDCLVARELRIECDPDILVLACL
jgi:hypothetical protein